MSIPYSSTRSRRRLAAAVQCMIACAAAAVIGVNSRTAIRLIPECPTSRWAGIYCPGCGSTRACARLLAGDIAGAWQFNPLLLVLGLPLAALYAWKLGWDLHGARPAPLPRLRPLWIWVMLGLILAFTVMRNIPGASLDWLRPPPADPGSR